MRTLTPLELQEGMRTATCVKTASGQLLAEAHITLTRQTINQIRFYGVRSIDIEEEPQKNTKPQVKHTSSETVTYSQKLKASAEFTSFQIHYFTVVEALKKSFHEVAENQAAIDYDHLLQSTATIFRSTRTITELFDLLHNMRSVNDSIYAHCLNVALISRMIGRWLHFDQHDLNVLTMSGLLHDIGKVKISATLLNKPGKLTEEEFSEIKKHPKYGYDLLKNQNIDSHIKKSALMHHERCDGLGYPMGFTDDGIDEYAMIVAIADVYDAMTAARSYRAPLCPFQVIANFERDGFQKYHTKYILTFLHQIANTYQSNRVILSDGRGCKIVLLNPNSLSRPMVQFDDDTCLDLATAPRDLFIKSII